MQAPITAAFHQTQNFVTPLPTKHGVIDVIGFTPTVTLVVDLLRGEPAPSLLVNGHHMHNQGMKEVVNNRLKAPDDFMAAETYPQAFRRLFASGLRSYVFVDGARGRTHLIAYVKKNGGRAAPLSQRTLDGFQLDLDFSMDLLATRGGAIFELYMFGRTTFVFVRPSVGSYLFEQYRSEGRHGAFRFVRVLYNQMRLLGKLMGKDVPPFRSDSSLLAKLFDVAGAAEITKILHEKGWLAPNVVYLTPQTKGGLWSSKAALAAQGCSEAQGEEYVATILAAPREERAKLLTTLVPLALQPAISSLVGAHWSSKATLAAQGCSEAQREEYVATILAVPREERSELLATLVPLELQPAISTLVSCRAPGAEAAEVAASLLRIRNLPLLLETAKTELLCESIGVNHFCNNVLRKIALTHTDLPELKLFDKWAQTFKYQTLHTDLAGQIRAIESSTALPPAHHGSWAGPSNVQAMETNTLVNELLALETRGLSTMLEAAKTRLLAQELGQNRFLDKVLGKIALSRDDVPVLSSFQDWAAKQQRPPLMSVANRLAGKIRSLERL